MIESRNRREKRLADCRNGSDDFTKLQLVENGSFTYFAIAQSNIEDKGELGKKWRVNCACHFSPLENDMRVNSPVRQKRAAQQGGNKKPSQCQALLDMRLIPLPFIRPRSRARDCGRRKARWDWRLRGCTLRHSISASSDSSRADFVRP